jgi:hypothetical protein
LVDSSLYLTGDEMINFDLNREIILVSSLSYQEIIKEAQDSLSWEKIREFSCVVCDLLVSREKGSQMALTDPSFFTLLPILSGSLLIPPLSPKLREEYCIFPLVKEHLLALCEEIQASYQDALLSPRGVKKDQVFCCSSCLQVLQHDSLPGNSIANHNAIGSGLEEFKDATAMVCFLCFFRFISCIEEIFSEAYFQTNCEIQDAIYV